MTEPKRDYKTLYLRLSQGVGLTDSLSLPSREYSGDVTSKLGEKNWRVRSQRHIAAVLEGRGILNIVEAIKKAGYYGALMELPEVRRVGVVEAAQALQKRWSPRLMVHLWDRLELSRTGCDLLRHVLSFQYAPTTDHYNRLQLWTNPKNESDSVDFPVLPGRVEREREYSELAETCGIEVSATGNCQRDACMAAQDLYTNYKTAMRTNFSRLRPAQPLFMFDGTGQSLGKGLCHAELGSADFKGDCMQSRKTLQPL